MVARLVSAGAGAMGQVDGNLVYVVDDDPLVLKAVERVLQAEGYKVATFNSPRAFLDAHDPSLPGCTVLDVGMTELSGLETQNELLALGDTRPIIFITGHDDVRTGILAMKAGARDYLVKPVPPAVLLEAVAAAVQSDLTAHQERARMTELARQWETLTNREQEVMVQVARGRLNKQIAFDLGIVEKTTKVHRGRVMEKMALRSVAELVQAVDQLERAGYMSKNDDEGSPRPGSSPIL
jgi:FixJ family two-component response regulator